MQRKLVSLAFLVFMGLSSLVCYCLALVIWALTVWWDRRLALLHLFTCFWGSLYIWIMPAWSVTIEGREKLVDRPMVIVSNHLSMLDILVAFGLFFPFKWVSKTEIFRIPFIGWNMVLNQYIRLVRGDRESGKQMIRACEDALKKGASVYLFPEGTRSKTGEVKDFKAGAFIVAHSMKVPIQPIVITGTEDALPKHSLDFHGSHAIRLKVLNPVPYESFADLSVEQTSDLIRGIIVAEVAAQRRVLQPQTAVAS
ncbi:MAG: lysophospholipid acyltransferase family protein [Candidatus Sericytochromatia bacterium]